MLKLLTKENSRNIPKKTKLLKIIPTHNQFDGCNRNLNSVGRISEKRKRLAVRPNAIGPAQ